MTMCVQYMLGSLPAVARQLLALCSEAHQVVKSLKHVLYMIQLLYMIQVYIRHGNTYVHFLLTKFCILHEMAYTQLHVLRM